MVGGKMPKKPAAKKAKSEAEVQEFKEWTADEEVHEIEQLVKWIEAENKNDPFTRTAGISHIANMPCLDAMMPWELQQELQDAVLRGDGALVDELLTRIHVNLLDPRDDDDRTPLFNACMLGHGDIAAKLIATKGVDVNTHDIEGNTALYVAAANGNMEAVRHLCIAGADPTICGRQVITPFKAALVAGHKKVADGLMYYELKWRAAFFANVESQKRATVMKAEEARRQLIRKQQGIHLQATLKLMRERETAALMPSDEESDEHVIEFCRKEIEKLGAGELDIPKWTRDVSPEPKSPAPSEVSSEEEVAIETEEQKKARHQLQDELKVRDRHQQQLRNVMAQKEAKTPAEDFKLEDQTVNLQTFSPFETLCAAGNRGDLETCIKMGALTPIDPPVDQGHTPLVWAVVGGQPHVVQWLISRGVDVRRRDACGYTAMFHAVQHAKDDIVKMLAQHCPELLHDLDYEGHNLAQWAAFSGSISTLRLLVEQCRVSIEVLDCERKSVLHWAAQQGHAEVLNYLMPRCSKDLWFTKDTSGLTAEDQARMAAHNESAALIRSYYFAIAQHRNL